MSKRWPAHWKSCLIQARSAKGERGTADPSPADWLKEIPKQEIPNAIGLLEAAKAQLWARLMEPVDTSQKTNGNEPDRLLTAEEAAGMLTVTPRWLYRHAKRLPFARRLSRKALRLSENGLRKWQAVKRA